MNRISGELVLLVITTTLWAGENSPPELIRQNPSAYTDNSGLNNPSNFSGATNPRTGEFYAPAAGGGLTGTRDGRLLVPAGPSGYIDTRSGAFVPAH